MTAFDDAVESLVVMSMVAARSDGSQRRLTTAAHGGGSQRRLVWVGRRSNADAYATESVDETAVASECVLKQLCASRHRRHWSAVVSTPRLTASDTQSGRRVRNKTAANWILISSRGDLVSGLHVMTTFSIVKTIFANESRSVCRRQMTVDRRDSNCVVLWPFLKTTRLVAQSSHRQTTLQRASRP